MIRRVEILYDFDFRAFEYYKNGLNNHPSLRFSRNDDNYLPLEAIKERDSIDSLYLLGAGMDKICISDSFTKSCFIIEPCPAIFFICKMEETFKYFLNEKRKGKENIMDGGLLMTESLFRTGGERGENELWISFTFKYLNNEWFIGIGRVSSNYYLEMELMSFLSAYFEFTERIIEFYNFVLPEYKEFTYQYPLFLEAAKNSCIIQEFKVMKQSSCDNFTYYDYQ